MKMLLLAAPPTGEAAKAGPWGFAVLLLLAIAFYFLFKSMSRHLRKVRDQFPTDEPPGGAEARLAGSRRRVAAPERAERADAGERVDPGQRAEQAEPAPSRPKGKNRSR